MCHPTYPGYLNIVASYSMPTHHCSIPLGNRKSICSSLPSAFLMAECQFLVNSLSDKTADLYEQMNKNNIDMRRSMIEMRIYRHPKDHYDYILQYAGRKVGNWSSN